MFLRAGQRGDPALLREGGWVTSAMALDGVNRFGDRFARGSEAEPPAGHAPGFREAMNDDSVIVMRRRKTCDALMGSAIVKQMFVNLVAHDEHALFNANIS